MFLCLTGIHIVLTITPSYVLCNSMLWLHVRHLVCIHFIYFFRKKGILSSKMQRNVAASNDQLTNRITRL